MEFKHIPVMLEPCMELLGLDRHPDGVFVKAFSNGPSIARDCGKILVGDRLCAVNSHPVATTGEAKSIICSVRFLSPLQRRIRVPH